MMAGKQTPVRKRKQGQIVIISSPSGGGKTSICNAVMTPERRKQGWRFSISYTTRQKRPGEQNGREYHFVEDRTFMSLRRRGEFAEDCRVHLYRYATPRAPLEKVITNGGVMLLDVDVQGAEKLRRRYKEAITIFILPPSLIELRKRLTKRGTESREQKRVRFENARKEMKLYNKFDYVVINDHLETAVGDVLSIIQAHPCRTQFVRKSAIRQIVG
ncbi:MAG: guanylate kinase [Candidatus Zixiibacteriota bacterium]